MSILITSSDSLEREKEWYEAILNFNPSKYKYEIRVTKNGSYRRSFPLSSRSLAAMAKEINEEAQYASGDERYSIWDVSGRDGHEICVAKDYAEDTTSPAKIKKRLALVMKDAQSKLKVVLEMIEEGY